MFEIKLNIFLNFFDILYADDTVLVAESPEELQINNRQFSFLLQKVEFKDEY